MSDGGYVTQQLHCITRKRLKPLNILRRCTKYCTYTVQLTGVGKLSECKKGYSSSINKILMLLENLSTDTDGKHTGKTFSEINGNNSNSLEHEVLCHNT
jgi:hypothetical protein